MEINGQGFTLRGYRLDDAASLQKHANNPNVYACLLDSFPHPYTMQDAISWVILQQGQNPVVNFIIAIDDKAIGVIGLEMRDDVYRKAPLLGYWIGEDFWGRGIMPNAVMLITEYAFANLDIVRIQAGIFSNNPRSMRVLEKAGYKKECVLQKSIVKNGIILDEYIYAIVK